MMLTKTYMVTRMPRFRDDIAVTYIAERGKRRNSKIKWYAMPAELRGADYAVAPSAVPMAYRRAAKVALARDYDTK
jgi:hypothetical protein